MAPQMTSQSQTLDVQVKPSPTVSVPNAEDMFLSPRVMDAGAFARFSESLKSIINQASEQGRALEDFAADAEEMIRRAQGAEQTLDKRLQAGVRLMKLIEERVESANGALEAIKTEIPDSEALAARVEEGIQAALVKAVEKIETRAREAEHRAQAATERADQAADRLKALDERIEERMRIVEERLSRSSEHASAAIDSINTAAANATSRLESDAETILDRTQTRMESIAAQANSYSQRAAAQVDALAQTIAPVRQAAEEAIRVLGMDPQDPKLEDSPISRIESLVERGETHIAGADRLFRQLEDLRHQAEGVKSDFGTWLLSAADKLDELETRRERIEGPIENAARAIESCSPELLEQIERAQVAINDLRTNADELGTTVVDANTQAQYARNELSNQSAQMQALLDGSINRLTERVEQAGQWLGTLITQAREHGTALGGDPSKPVSINTETAPRLVTNDETTIDDLPDLPDLSPAPMPINDTMIENAPVEETRMDEGRTDEVRIDESPTPIENPLRPIPERLSIDSISFDGSDQVFEHSNNEDDDQQPRSAD